MKKFISVLLVLGFSSNMSFAQIDNYIKKPSFSFYFVLDDFNGAIYFHSHDLRDAVNNHQLTDFKGMDPGLAIGYLRGISKHFDFAGTFSFNTTDYPTRANDGTTLGSRGALLEADASVVGKMFDDGHFFTPFFKVGVGASQFQGYYGAFIPLGVGFQFKLAPDAFALFNWQYRLPVTEIVNYHFYYSVGIAGSISENKKAAVLVPPPPPPLVEAPKDRDGDGVVDSLDACPDVAGLPQFKGCPDTDGDGIPDKDDKCPTVPGFARYNGCPIPDSDGDGINDELDKCPTVAGVARYNGCPIPDSDGDGVNDEEDKCPNVPGVKENQGCPLVKEEILKKVAYNAKNIFFATGSSKLLSRSFKPLNEVAKILKEDGNLKLDIEGHTDNAGKPERNQLLSENRAKAVQSYLKTKGGVEESRLSAAGYGDTKPVASNKSPKGKAQNRRVELKLKYY
ncbi:MAG TPA: OmpA family protein [Puia sp.]|jgi:OOP family OmpA-OmpF porin|nr:OmpA family protein [Puia sp.]